MSGARFIVRGQSTTPTFYCSPSGLHKAQPRHRRNHKHKHRREHMRKHRLSCGRHGTWWASAASLEAATMAAGRSYYYANEKTAPRIS